MDFFQFYQPTDDDFVHVARGDGSGAGTFGAPSPGDCEEGGSGSLEEAVSAIAARSGGSGSTGRSGSS